jgi:hypothetical protein
VHLTRKGCRVLEGHHAASNGFHRS